MPEITSRLSTALADRYKLEGHLGEGGMATVYLADDVKHRRKVAVKVLRPSLPYLRFTFHTLIRLHCVDEVDPRSLHRRHDAREQPGKRQCENDSSVHRGIIGIHPERHRLERPA